MQIATFKDMYIAELQELASVENQLADALLTMSEMASHPALKRALIGHRENTLAQREQLITILQRHGADAKAHTDQAMQALIAETEKMYTILQGQDLRDAALIASAPAYGTAAALAGQLDLRDEQRTLHDSMEEEKKMDLQLTQLAKSEVNQDALAA